jgi:cation transport ATPase
MKPEHNLIQEFIGLSEKLRFVGELKNKKPGMMTLIALAISTAYFYSSAVVFGLPGMVFFGNLQL